MTSLNSRGVQGGQSSPDFLGGGAENELTEGEREILQRASVAKGFAIIRGKKCSVAFALPCPSPWFPLGSIYSSGQSLERS